MRETSVVSDQILNSWKEIAQYLNRGVRTVQRWESELGLPVRRPRGRRRSAVIAMRSEIDQWLNRCPLEAREQVAASETAVLRTEEPTLKARIGQENLKLRAEEENLTVSDLILASRVLREDLHRSQTELHAMIERLVNTITEYRTLIRERRRDLESERLQVLDVVETTRVA
jgi:predicted DNA-binding transcriptional regulator AlpA